MSFLASVMPGVRQLRTPLIVGAAWLLVVYLALSPSWGSTLSKYRRLRDLWDDVTAIETVYLLAALAVVAYVLGVCVGPLAELATRVMARLVSVVAPRMERLKSPLLAPWRRALGRRRAEHLVRGPVFDAVGVRFAEAGLPADCHMIFPVDMLLDRLESVALQLWKKAPDQYQESDRIVAEADFRSGLSLPAMISSCILGFQIAWWCAVPGLVIGVVLLLQAEELRAERRALLANAIYQGLASFPSLDLVIAQLKMTEIPRNSPWVFLCAITSSVLERIGEFEWSEEVRVSALAETGPLYATGDAWRSNAAQELRHIQEAADLNPELDLTAFEESFVSAARRVEEHVKKERPDPELDWRTTAQARQRAWVGIA